MHQRMTAARSYPEAVDPTTDVRDRDETYHRMGGPIYQAEVTPAPSDPTHDDVGPWRSDERREEPDPTVRREAERRATTPRTLV